MPYVIKQAGSDVDCGSAVVTWVGDGTLHPVWSGRRIYKNIACARCHGVAEKDVQFWNTSVVCLVGSPFAAIRTRLDHLYTLKRHFSETTCRVFYRLNEARIDMFKCSDQVYSTCRSVILYKLTVMCFTQCFEILWNI